MHGGQQQGIDRACKSTAFQSPPPVISLLPLSSRLHLNMIVCIAFTCAWRGERDVGDLFAVGLLCSHFAYTVSAPHTLFIFPFIVREEEKTPSHMSVFLLSGGVAHIYIRFQQNDLSYMFCYVMLALASAQRYQTANELQPACRTVTRERSYREVTAENWNDSSARSQTELACCESSSVSVSA